MFRYTIDSKTIYTGKDGTEIVDLTDTIFNPLLSPAGVYSYYRVTRGMDMRPDKISSAAYGDQSYAEMIMKYSRVDNPFAIEENDIVIVPTLTSVYTDVKDLYIDRDNGGNDYAYVRNFHKYIDSSKIPDVNGSTGSVRGNNATNVKSGSSLTGSLNTISGDAELGNMYSYDDLGVRDTYGNTVGYGSDYNLTDSNIDNPLEIGSGKSGIINSDEYTSDTSNSYGAGTTPIGDSAYKNSGIPGVTYDDDDDIITETLYDENGNEVPINNVDNQVDNTSYDPNGPVEANLSNNNKSGITLSNGRIYFGDSTVSANPNDVTDVDGTNSTDSPLVDCARSGVTIGQFLNATIKNMVKNK